MSDIDKATKNLVDWMGRGQWPPRLSRLHIEHIDPVAQTFDVGPYDLFELLGDAVGMLSVFIIEDFLTLRFGESGELNVIDEYLERRGWQESIRAKRYLEALRDSSPSLYEVVDLDPGRSVTVRDLLVQGEAVTVQERLGSEGMAPWDCIAARIVVVNGDRLFTGAMLHFVQDSAKNVLSHIDQKLKESKKELGEAFRRATARPGMRRGAVAREAIIRSLPCAKILTHFWLTDALTQAQAPLPELRNTDDEDMLFCEVRFPIVGDKAAIATVLDGIENFEQVEGAEAEWIWNASGSPTYRVAQLQGLDSVGEPENGFGTTTLGHAVLGAEVLTLSVNSMERAERGEALLSFRLGRLVGRPLISSQDPYQAMETRSAEPALDTSEPPPEELVQQIHSVLDAHYRRTLDEPIPALGGMTPRYAVTTKEGREQAIDWLKGLENSEYRRAALQGQRPYDTRWMWQELGLERTH